MKGFNLHRVIEEFESMTENAALVQRETLRSILDQNAEAEYLQHLGLGGRTDPDSFKSCVPVTTHEELQPYIQRIIDGDGSPLLSGKPPLALSLSSGTTRGKSKYLPFSEEMLQASMQIYRTSFAYINRDYPVENGKVLQFIYTSKQSKTRGGLIATTGTTNIYISKEYKDTMKEIQPPLCSPDEVIISSTDFEQSLYCHLLCGLIYYDEVQFISSTFAHNIVHALGTFEHVWEEICSDIREGVLSSRITSPSVREAVAKILTPDRSLADTIYKKCLGLGPGNWHDLIPELWPNAKYVYAIMTGSMEPYVNKLRHYAGNLPLVSAYYGASEGWIGANVNPKSQPESSTYAVFPNFGYFEFIPLKRETSGSGPGYTESEPVGLTEVEVGEEYEVVITNHGGLYRYRLGDVVKIAGFHNSTPELRFICRRNLMPSINIDKNTEKDLQVAVEQAFGQLLSAEKLDLIDFTSHIDRSSNPGHYVIYLELSGGAGEDVLASCCDILDGAFVDAGYVVSRKTGDIGPLELRIARRGTFRKIMEHYMSNGATLSQYKTPRCVGPSNDKVLQILGDNVVSKHFSTAYD